MEGWGGITLTATTSSGNLTQLYPNWLAAGNALPIAPGGTLRQPRGGRIGQVSIQTDNADGGTIELWDITGIDYPADVSSGNTITNAQLLTLKTLGKAKLVWSQNFAANPASPAPWSLAMGFMKGLAARFIASAGSCNLNLIVEGGYDSHLCPNGFTG